MSKCVLSVAALFLLLPASLRAQTAGPSIGGGNVVPMRLPTTDRRQMAEDVEIMRRLLGRALAGARVQACMSCHVPQVSFSPDGKVLSGHALGGVRLGDADLCAPGRALRALAFSPDGKILATQGGDAT